MQHGIEKKKETVEVLKRKRNAIEADKPVVKNKAKAVAGKKTKKS